MSKYRVIEKTKANGDVCYYVQKKWLFMWFIHYIKFNIKIRPLYFEIDCQKYFSNLGSAKDCIINIIYKDTNGVKKEVEKVVYTCNSQNIKPPNKIAWL